MEMYGITYPSHNKPVVLYFTAPWCVPCKRFGPVMDLVEEMTPDVQFIKVDADEHFTVATRYNVKSLPTLVYLYNEEVKGRLMGAQSGGQVLQWLDGIW